MELNTNPMNKPDYTMDKSMDYTTADTIEEDKNREAICKACGTIWHPRKTDTRRPTRCPYCQSRRTEWLDYHMKVDREQMSEPDLSDNQSTQLHTNNPAEKETAAEPMEKLETSLKYTADEVEKLESDNDKDMDYTTVSRSKPRINPDYSGDYATQQKKNTGIPIAVLFALLGAGLLYGIYHLWKTWKIPEKQETGAVSIPQEIIIEKTNMGLTAMSGHMHRF